MNSLWSKLEPVLMEVQAPAQYIGGEWNSIVKNPADTDARFVLAFPDAYKIGMSHLGLQILYKIVNDLPFASAERMFMPWLDLQHKMETHGIPLFSLETHSPASEFDVIGFSVQYELAYTNIVKMLRLAGLPVFSSDRKKPFPLVIAGGCGVMNPEPIADFIDVFVIGDGETAIAELAGIVRDAKKSGAGRRELLLEIARKVPGSYVPSFYEPVSEGGLLREIKPLEQGIPENIIKAVEKDFENAPFPLKPVVPWIETVHDRINVEIMRGCPHACNFCQSKCAKTPVRIKTPQLLVEQAEAIFKNTGYDEVSLNSLSSGEYPHIIELVQRLNARLGGKKVNISLPSLRVTEEIKSVPEMLNIIRKSGLTFAPEAGNDFLRAVIGKRIKDEDLLGAIRSAYYEGWNMVKLYFMLGLPREERQDVESIAALINRSHETAKSVKKGECRMNITLSLFVPKSHTPFQWEAMKDSWLANDDISLIKRSLRSRSIQVKYQDTNRSFLEGVFARGDRALGKAIVAAVDNGCQFDSWDEIFVYQKWTEAFEKSGVDPKKYIVARGEDEVFPWQHIEAGFSRSTLWKQREKAYEARRESPGEASAPAAS